MCPAPLHLCFIELVGVYTHAKERDCTKDQRPLNYSDFRLHMIKYAESSSELEFRCRFSTHGTYPGKESSQDVLLKVRVRGGLTHAWALSCHLEMILTDQQHAVP